MFSLFLFGLYKYISKYILMYRLILRCILPSIDALISFSLDVLNLSTCLSGILWLAIVFPSGVFLLVRAIEPDELLSPTICFVIPYCAEGNSRHFTVSYNRTPHTSRIHTSDIFLRHFSTHESIYLTSSGNVSSTPGQNFTIIEYASLCTYYFSAPNLRRVSLLWIWKMKSCFCRI